MSYAESNKGINMGCVTRIFLRMIIIFFILLSSIAYGKLHYTFISYYQSLLESSSGTVLSLNQSSPSYDIVCPGDTLVFTCITSYQEGGGVVWRINGLNRFLTSNKTEQINGFMLTIIDFTNNTITSTATNVSASLQLNGTVIDCTGDGVQHSNTLTVHIAGKIHNESYVT